MRVTYLCVRTAPRQRESRSFVPFILAARAISHFHSATIPLKLLPPFRLAHNGELYCNRSNLRKQLCTPRDRRLRKQPRENRDAPPRECGKRSQPVPFEQLASCFRSNRSQNTLSRNLSIVAKTSKFFSGAISASPSHLRRDCVVRPLSNSTVH